MSEDHSNVGAYATDALDPAATAALQQHLLGCETCRFESEEFHETVAELTRLVATQPPAGLRDEVLGAVRSVRPLPPKSGRAEDRSPVRLHVRSGRGRRAPSTRLLAGIAAAAAVLALGSGGWAVQAHQELAAERSVTEQRQIIDQREAALLRAPDLQVRSAALTSGGEVSYLVSRRQQVAMLISSRLPALGTRQTYEAWVFRGGRPSPDLTFAGGAPQRMFLTGDVSDADAIKITIEPAGGSHTPRGELVSEASL